MVKEKIEKFKVIVIGHTDQKKSFELLLSNREEVVFIFLNIDDFFDKAKVNLGSKISSYIHEDRYVMGTFAPLIQNFNFLKKKQLKFIYKLSSAEISIYDFIKSTKPDLVLFERNNFIGQSLGDRLKKKNILNGWLLPVRLSNNLIYLEQGYLDTPFIFSKNIGTISNLLPSNPDYLKLHRVRNIFDYFKKRNNYKSKKDYRKYLYGLSFLGKIKSFIRRYEAYYFHEKISIKNISSGIFYYLHHQPEFSLESSDYKWYDQVQKVREIRRNIPLSIPLYLKESPSMFLKRSKEDLFELWKLPNTFFVSKNLDNIKLYPHMKAVISFSGTIALEAVLNGIPSIVFKNTWFSNLKGIFCLNSIDDLSNNLEFILDQKIDKYKSLCSYKKIVSKIAIEGKTFGNGRINENQYDADLTYLGILKILNESSKR